MAVDKQAYAAIAPWTVTTVCDLFEEAFIDAGLMTAWYDSFTADGREHRVLEVTYDVTKAYGKTYYWFTINGVGVWMRTAPVWDALNHQPDGLQYVDWRVQNMTDMGEAPLLLTISNSISCSLTRYTSGSRTFFVFRSGFTHNNFTIDPSDTTFRSFYNLDYGYHSGLWNVAPSGTRILFYSLYRTRRDLFLGGQMNAGSNGYGSAAVMNIFALAPTYGNYTWYNSGWTPPQEGYILPSWNTFSSPSIPPSGLNPVYTGMVPNSVVTSPLPDDFGMSMIKNSNLLAIQDNATVTPGVEEYEILHFVNGNVAYQSSNGITSNPVFLARTI
jgi:hypothetical protein